MKTPFLVVIDIEFSSGGDGPRDRIARILQVWRTRRGEMAPRGCVSAGSARHFSMSGDPAQLPVVRQLMALPTADLFELYFELAATDPERSDVAALAIREQGR